MPIPQSALDTLWDFSDPAASEHRLRAAAGAETDAATRAELQTQVARALGLQERFAEADAVLDELEADAGVEAGPAEVGVRIALERGRLRNSAGQPEQAVPREAAQAAGAASRSAEDGSPNDVGLVFLKIDALHMLAIADPAGAAVWTAEALGVLDGADDPRTLRWRVGLHNNAGWARLDAGDIPGAIAEFERAKDAAIRWGTPQQVEWADEALAEARAARSAQLAKG